MNIFEHIYALGFPLGQYVVVGGAAMVARGIKDTTDIDIVVTPALFERCKYSDWEQKSVHRVGLRCGLIELYLEVNCGNFNPNFEYLLWHSEIIKDVCFLNLTEVLKFKKEYGREKDVADVVLIQNYYESLKELQQIPGVGKSIAADLYQLGIRSINDLAGQSPEKLYQKLCIQQNKQVDRCVFYVFRCAVYFVSNKKHKQELLKWWNWKDK